MTSAKHPPSGAFLEKLLITQILITFSEIQVFILLLTNVRCFSLSWAKVS